jgi:hypothetical protein
VLAEEQAATCAGFLRRAGAFFAAHGIGIQRVLSVPPVGAERVEADQADRMAGAGLAPDSFEAALAAGRGLEPDEALRVALG